MLAEVPRVVFPLTSAPQGQHPPSVGVCLFLVSSMLNTQHGQPARTTAPVAIEVRARATTARSRSRLRR
jgi:hypothetical protein